MKRVSHFKKISMCLLACLSVSAFAIDKQTVLAPGWDYYNMYCNVEIDSKTATAEQLSDTTVRVTTKNYILDGAGHHCNPGHCPEDGTLDPLAAATLLDHYFSGGTQIRKVLSDMFFGSMFGLRHPREYASVTFELQNVPTNTTSFKCTVGTGGRSQPYSTDRCRG